MIDGVIENSMFSIYLTNTTADSKIHFGGYDEELVTSMTSTWSNETRELYPDGIFWNEISSDIHWQIPIYKVKIELKEMEATASNVLFDTGSSLCYLPNSEY